MKKFTSVIEDFIHLYSNTPVSKRNKKCLIPQSHPLKIVWDLLILSILLLISLIVPYRLAFEETEDPLWQVVYLVTDAFFLIDIILTFFTSVTDEKKVYEIINKWEIAKRYLKGWFWIDVISILPLDLMLLN